MAIEYEIVDQGTLYGKVYVRTRFYDDIKGTESYLTLSYLNAQMVSTNFDNDASQIAINLESTYEENLNLEELLERIENHFEASAVLTRAQFELWKDEKIPSKNPVMRPIPPGLMATIDKAKSINHG